MWYFVNSLLFKTKTLLLQGYKYIISTQSWSRTDLRNRHFHKREQVSNFVKFHFVSMIHIIWIIFFKWFHLWEKMFEILLWRLRKIFHDVSYKKKLSNSYWPGKGATKSWWLFPSRIIIYIWAMIFMDFRNSYSGLHVASGNIILIFWVSVCNINLKFLGITKIWV